MLPLASEYVFRKLFSKEENNSILKDFLEAILERKILKIAVLNPQMPKDLLDSKMGILDLKVKLENEEIIDIELEMKSEFNIKEKSKTNLTKFLSEQFQEEYEYIEKKKIIAIYICNFNFFKRNAYHSIAKMRFEPNNHESFVNMGYLHEDEIATDMIEMHFIELPKFTKSNSKSDTKLEQWMWLLAGTSPEKLAQAMQQNVEIAKAVKALEELSKNQEEKEWYQCRKKAEWEYIETIDYFTKKRIKEGIEKGERKEKTEIAQKMLQEKIEPKTIERVTGFSLNEITKLSKNSIFVS